MSHTRQTKSARLLNVLKGYSRVLVVTHDNPDPDAVAAGWGIVSLVKECLRKRARLIGGGDILRAENRHMVRLLGAPIELVSGIACPPHTAVVLIDCQSGGQNHVFCGNRAPVVAVIDHHEISEPDRRLPFQDIRPRVAASATIAASYLREEHLEPSQALATAMLFAIRTETCGSETYYSRLDRSILPWLTERTNPSQLAEIENAPLTRDYFGDLLLALQCTFVYDDTAICLLPRASGPEIIGEVADLLIRCENIWRVLCGAFIRGDVLVSVRAERAEDDASQLVQLALEGLGEGGGHRHRAGGKIPRAGRGPKIPEDLQEAIRDRWLAACRVHRQRGTRLVARRRIVENL